MHSRNSTFLHLGSNDRYLPSLTSLLITITRPVGSVPLLSFSSGPEDLGAVQVT
jgi:hypothetical protein